MDKTKTTPEATYPLHRPEEEYERLARAEQLGEFLVCLAIATVSAGVGFYLQQRFKWKIPGIN